MQPQSSLEKRPLYKCLRYCRQQPFLSCHPHKVPLLSRSTEERCLDSLFKAPYLSLFHCSSPFHQPLEPSQCLNKRHLSCRKSALSPFQCFFHFRYWSLSRGFVACQHGLCVFVTAFESTCWSDRSVPLEVLEDSPWNRLDKCTSPHYTYCSRDTG